MASGLRHWRGESRGTGLELAELRTQERKAVSILGEGGSPSVLAPETGAALVSHGKSKPGHLWGCRTSVLLFHILSARPLVSVPVYFILCAYLCLSGFSKGLYTS